ncbi:MAG: response regulator [Allomuricauda sp.]|nr:MAG: response regulator [Allomuricauda sp.]
MKILCIDDEKLFLLSTKKALTDIGYEVRTANCIEEGIMAFNTFEPDLVLLDMNMPEMSGNNMEECTGTEVVKYIRMFLRRSTPILVVSGNTDLSVKIKNLEMGINDYLHKPLSNSELLYKTVKTIGNPQRTAV